MLTRPVRFGRVGLGGMVMYEATESIVIDAVDQYHAVTGFSEGDHVEGFTFLASSTGAITDTENNGGVLRCTDVGHGLTTGQYITLTGMGDANHVGSTRVTVITVDVFDCDNIVYNSDDDTGNWTRGSSATLDTGYDGMYLIVCTCSWLSDGNLKNYKFKLVKNNTGLDEIVFEEKIGTASDLQSSGAGGHEMLAADDVVWMQVECTTDGTDLEIEHASVHLTKVN